jgi:hypothetical protein
MDVMLNAPKSNKETIPLKLFITSPDLINDWADCRVEEQDYSFLRSHT